MTGGGGRRLHCDFRTVGVYLAAAPTPHSVCLSAVCCCVLPEVGGGGGGGDSLLLMYILY